MRRFSRIPLIPPTSRQRSRRAMTPSYKSTTTFNIKKDRINSQDAAMPQLTAQAWSITDEAGNLIWGKASTEQKNIASLSKMMTLYVTYRYISAGAIGFKTEVQVSQAAASTGGTSANLKQNDKLKVVDLLYALMLPSGNDAANVLAEEIGLLAFNNTPRAKRVGKTPQMVFIDEMNSTARSLGMRSTKYANPHGMDFRGNKSTAGELGKLASQILAHDELAEIVNAKQYSCTIQGTQGPYTATWFNTNRLLWQNFSGIKTGTTDSAGFCLCSSVTRNETTIIITVLNSRTDEKRWLETMKLADWAYTALQEHRSSFFNNAKTGKPMALTY